MAKDHYVPQFYLRNFSPAQSPNQVYRYRKTEGPQLVAINSVACEIGYYPSRIDKIFSRQAKESAQTIKKLLDSPRVDVTPKERKRLAAFIGTLGNRTPKTQERLHNQHSIIVESLEDFFSDKEEFYRSERAHGFSGTEDELEAVRLGLLESAKQNFLQHDRTKTHDGLIGTALELAEDTEAIIEGRNWRFLESTTSRVFVTSDNPVVLCRPEAESLWQPIGLRRGSVLLPLSPKRCLLVDDNQRGNTIIPIDREKADRINQLMMVNAYETVFGNLSSKTIASAFDSIRIQL
jgi:hypothetical protein